MRWGRLAIALAWGALPAAAVALVVLTYAGPHLSRWALLVLAAPLVEEPLKAVGAAWAEWRPRRLVDGALAGAAAGLGFGLTESILRWWLGPEGFVLLTVGVHAVASGLAGTAWVLARAGRPLPSLALAGSALLTHAAWNASVVAA